MSQRFVKIFPFLRNFFNTFGHHESFFAARASFFVVLLKNAVCSYHFHKSFKLICIKGSGGGRGGSVVFQINIIFLEYILLSLSQRGLGLSYPADVILSALHYFLSPRTRSRRNVICGCMLCFYVNLMYGHAARVVMSLAPASEWCLRITCGLRAMSPQLRDISICFKTPKPRRCEIENIFMH